MFSGGPCLSPCVSLFGWRPSQTCMTRRCNMMQDVNVLGISWTLSEQAEQAKGRTCHSSIYASSHLGHNPSSTNKNDEIPSIPFRPLFTPWWKKRAHTCLHRFAAGHGLGFLQYPQGEDCSRHLRRHPRHWMGSGFGMDSKTLGAEVNAAWLIWVVFGTHGG